MLSSRTLHMTPWVQGSRQDHKYDEPKNQPVEDEYGMLSNYSKLWNKTQVMDTAHSAILYFTTRLSPTCMFACVWVNTLWKVFVRSSDQQWHQPMTFHMCAFYTTYTLVGYQLVSITSNFTHKRSCKRFTQQNVINRRTRLHSLEKDSRSFTFFS